jgi:hypothetical protein
LSEHNGRIKFKTLGSFTGAKYDKDRNLIWRNE